MSTVNALRYDETFDDDVVGNAPSSLWYTTSGTSLVTDVLFSSSPNGLRANNNNNLVSTRTFVLNDNSSTYNNNSAINLRYYPIDDVEVLILSVYNDTVRIFTISRCSFDATHFTLKWKNGSAYDYDNTTMYDLADWHQLNLTMNTTTSEFTFEFNSTQYGWYNFEASGDIFTNLVVSTASSLGTYFAYYDDLFLYTETRPEINVLTPVNNSYATSPSVSFSAQVWTNGSVSPITVDFYIYQDTYVPIWLGWDNKTSLYSGTTVNISSGEIAYCNLTLKCPGLSYAWFIRVQSGGSSYFFPTSGYNWSGDFGSPDPSCDFVWLFTASNNSKPEINITYPVNGNTYTKYQWRLHPYVNFTINDTEGDTMDAWVSLSNDYGDVFIPYPGGLLLPLAIENIGNGSYGFDLSGYVTFENMEYNVTISVEDDAHCVIGGGLNSTYSLFKINTTPDLTKHISIKDCYPPDEEVNAYTLMQSEFSWDMCMNITYTGYPDVWVFLVDNDKATIVYGTRICTLEQSSGVMWKHFKFGKGFFLTRESYSVYIGVYISGRLPGSQTKAKAFTTANTQFDLIYDDTAKFIGDFTWHHFYSTTDKGYIYRPNYITEDASVDANDAKFYGVRVEFATYPPGERPSDVSNPDRTGSDWGRNVISRIETSYGLQGLGIMVGLVIVGIFSLIPYILIRRRAKKVPLPITASFTLFGLFFAFGMGFFPVWIFILPTMFTLFFIFYKVRAYVTSRKQLIDTGGDEGGAT